MSKLFYILPVFLFMLVVVPASADWCRNPTEGGVVPCDTIPGSWTECGTFNGETLWCYPSASSNKRPKAKSDTTNTLIAVGVGVAFIGVMWYIFRKPASENNPGQVKLMAF